MNYRDAVTLRAEFLGALLQDRADYVPNAELLDFALHQELGPMVYFHWHDLLPEDCVGIFRKSYMASAAMDMKFSAAYTEIKNILDSEKVAYAPLKGMGLIRQDIYANGALRLHCDIDLLLKNQEDCCSAWTLLQEKGWKSSGNIEKYHHLPPLYRGNVMLEIHHLLPGVRDGELTESLWKNDLIPQHGSCEYLLPAELHWAVLLSHVAINHDWEHGAKFLTDAGMLLKYPGFNQEKCFDFCHKIGINNPENLLLAFPEIFGGSAKPDGFADLRVHALGAAIPFEALLMTHGYPFSLRWWRKRLEGFRPSWLRQKYNLPDASTRQMLKVMWMDYRKKICKGFKYMFASNSADERVKNSVNARKQLGVTTENEVFKHI